ncbi:MAG TPA: hypothetical protein VGD91_03420 [Trebonia sp.]
MTASKSNQRFVMRTDTAGHFAAEFTGGLRSPDAVVSACRPGFASREIRIPDGAQERGVTLTLLPVRTAGAQPASRAGTTPCP